MPIGDSKFGDSKGNPQNKNSKGNKGVTQATNNMGGGAARGGHGRGRGRGGARGGRGCGGGRGRGRGKGSTSATSTARTDQPSSIEKDNREREVIPCCFCNNPQHSANNYTQKMKPDTDYVKALEFQLCLNYLKAGHWASSCPHPGCDQDNCRGKHHRSMHGRSKELAPFQNSYKFSGLPSDLPVGVRGPSKEWKSPTVIFCNANVVFDLTKLHHHRFNNFTNISGRTLGGELQLAHPNLNAPQLLPTLMVPSRTSKDGKLRVLWTQVQLLLSSLQRL